SSVGSYQGHRHPSERQLSITRGKVCHVDRRRYRVASTGVSILVVSKDRMDTCAGLQCQQHVHVETDTSRRGGPLRRSSLGSNRRFERPIRKLVGNPIILSDGSSVRAFGRCRLSYAT